MAESTPKIVLNLDEFERKNTKDPFTVVVGGKPITFTDPEEMDWEDLAELDSPGDFIDLCLNDEDREHVYAQNLPAFKFKKLWEAYQQHYDLLAARGKRRG